MTFTFAVAPADPATAAAHFHNRLSVETDVSDVHTAADIAADVVQRLYTVYRVRAWDDGEPGPLRDGVTA